MGTDPAVKALTQFATFLILGAKEKTMTAQPSFRTAALIVVSSLALSACASKAPKQLPPDPGASVDTTTSSFIFELTGAPDKIDSFVALMRELGLVEVGRTGVVGMMRGAEAA